MSLLTIVQDAADEIGLPRPSSVIGSSDAMVRMLLRMANREGQELALRRAWQALIKETSIATVASTASYDLPSDFGRIVEGSMFNRTQTRPVVGPLTVQKWQRLKSTTTAASWDAFRIWGGQIVLHPTPTAVESIYYEYVSSAWCATSGDAAPDQSAWVADGDGAFLDEPLMTLGVIWRFKQARGLEYGEDFNSYERRLAVIAANDGGQSILDLSAEDLSGPGVYDGYLPDGSWSLT